MLAGISSRGSTLSECQKCLFIDEKDLTRELTVNVTGHMSKLQRPRFTKSEGRPSAKTRRACRFRVITGTTKQKEINYEKMKVESNLTYGSEQLATTRRGGFIDILWRRKDGSQRSVCLEGIVLAYTVGQTVHEA